MPGKILPQITSSLISLENIIFIFKNSPPALLPQESFMTLNPFLEL